MRPLWQRLPSRLPLAAPSLEASARVRLPSAREVAPAAVEPISSQSAQRVDPPFEAAIPGSAGQLPNLPSGGSAAPGLPVMSDEAREAAIADWKPLSGEDASPPLAGFPEVQEAWLEGRPTPALPEILESSTEASHVTVGIVDDTQALRLEEGGTLAFRPGYPGVSAAINHRLGEAVGIHMFPPNVPAKRAGVQGVRELWIEAPEVSLSELPWTHPDIIPADAADAQVITLWLDQRDLHGKNWLPVPTPNGTRAVLFDVSPDRALKPSWQWPSGPDETRGKSETRKLVDLEQISPELLAGLRGVVENPARIDDALAPLGDLEQYAAGVEIDRAGLVESARHVVEHFDRLVAERGEAAVLVPRPT